MNHSPLHHFAQALCAHLRTALETHGQSADYTQLAVKIIDAHNYWFQTLPSQLTDEENNIYAFRELCTLDEESFTLLPNLQRCLALGRDWGLKDE